MIFFHVIYSLEFKKRFHIVIRYEYTCISTTVSVKSSALPLSLADFNPPWWIYENHNNKITEYSASDNTHVCLFINPHIIPYNYVHYRGTCKH